MSATIYNKAFTVELSHNFYANTTLPENKFKVNGNLELVPTQECAELMKRGRMRFIRNGKGFILFYRAYVDATNTQKPLVKLNDGAEFVFAVRMPTDAMPLLTNVSNWDVNSKTYGADKLFMIESTVSNSANPQTIPLTASLANMLRPAIFPYTFKPSGGYTGLADVVVYDNAIEVYRVDDVPFNADTLTYSVEIDLSNQPKGFYTLTAFKANSTAPADIINTTDFYIDNNLSKQNTFGIIRIKYNTIDRLYDTTTAPANYKTFQYAFLARVAYWRYYIIPQNIDSAIYDFAVIDSETIPYQFTPTVPATDPQYGKPDTSITINGLHPIILKSTTQIPFSEKVLTSLSLYKKTGINATEVIRGLSNARFTGVDSDRLGAAQPVPTITPDISEIFVIA
jgi:hypothetical protein